MPKYRVLAGIDYAGIRREIGDIADDVPRQSIGWLVEQGVIEAADAGEKVTPATVTFVASSIPSLTPIPATPPTTFSPEEVP